MKKPEILMIVEQPFDNDSRVKKEVHALKQRFEITVIALRKKGDRLVRKMEGIRVIGIPEIPNVLPGKILYILQYFYITCLSTLLFLLTFPIRRYRVIHVHNPPDTLFAVGMLGKLFGVRFIFDHHDLSPELYLTRYQGRKDFLYRGLLQLERASVKQADVVISTNESYRELVSGRHGVDKSKFFVVRNNPIVEDYVSGNDNDVEKENDKKVLLFIGSMNPQDGLDILVEIIRVLVQERGVKNIICRVIGHGESLTSAIKMAKDVGISEYMEFTGYVGDRDKIRRYLHQADIGVEPAPKNPLNSHSTFIKVMEYMASGLPVIAFDLKETRFSASNSAILVHPGSIAEFAKSIEKLLSDSGLRKKLGNAGVERIRNDLNWGNASRNLFLAYDSLSWNNLKNPSV